MGFWRSAVAALGLVGISLLAPALTAPARAAEIVQLPVAGLLDGRPVATLTAGVVVPWTTGLDKDDGFMTMAAATSLHETGPALPDDGVFAANADHPEVRLHFSNDAAASSPQAHLVTAVGHFQLAVPAATYETVLLFLGSSYGDAPLAITLTYADATTTRVTFTLPDWGLGAPLPKSPRTFYLVSGLHKWTKAGASVDTPSHAITGIALPAAPDRVLTAIDVEKTTAAPWLTFWGATGIAVAAVPDGGIDAAPPDAPSEKADDVGVGVGVDLAPEAALADAAPGVPDAATLVDVPASAADGATDEAAPPMGPQPAGDASGAGGATGSSRAGAASGCALGRGTPRSYGVGALGVVLAVVARRRRRRRRFPRGACRG